MKRIKYILLFIISTSTFCSAQNVLLEKNVPDNFGQEITWNYLKNYSHFFLGYEIFPGGFKKDRLEINYGYSYSLILGFRYRRLINYRNAVGLGLNIERKTYYLKQNDSKVFPDNIMHESEVFTITEMLVDLYDRLLFGDYKKIRGKYLDLGFYGGLIYSTKHITKDKNNDLTVKTINTDIEYTNNLNYGLKIRLGFRRQVISLSYRLSDYFKEKYDFPEFSRFSFGLQMVFDYQ